jgi:sugar (pentulose or hexulose) kinase
VEAIAIFDIGKTNKKLLVFDSNYELIHEQSARFDEIADEDGDPCEDLSSLVSWMRQSLQTLQDRSLPVTAINFSAYGASFVHLDDKGKPLTPLYNYLKPYPDGMQASLHARWGGTDAFSQSTASPALGNLNSGLQLYRLKQQKPQLFAQIKYSLHLPQFLSYLLTGKPVTDITSIGCHTGLWDFAANDYHAWVSEEGMLEKFAPLVSCDSVFPALHPPGLHCGTGLHDSSAALIPYLDSFTAPFLLLSTGTWCISLNPFNTSLLTTDELKQDCLCYLQYNGRPVKAARLFAGQEHEVHVNRIADHFQLQPAFYENIRFNPALLGKDESSAPLTVGDNQLPASAFAQRGLRDYPDAATAYHRLMADIMHAQLKSTRLVLNGSDVSTIYVDGGFSKNHLYMQLLAAAFPDKKVYAASVAQASALGAALAIRNSWNKNNCSPSLVNTELYPPVWVNHV